LATSINPFTLLLKLTQDILQGIKVETLKISLAFVVLETYTPFGIPSRIITVVTLCL
jgi:hypothetical protein